MMLIEQDHLVEEHGPEAVGRFDRLGAQFVKDPTDFDPTIGVRVRAPARGDQFPVVAVTLGAQVWSIIMLIAQDIANLGGQLRILAQAGPSNAARRSFSSPMPVIPYVPTAREVRTHRRST